jgi:hypothetical protein
MTSFLQGETKQPTSTTTTTTSLDDEQKEEIRCVLKDVMYLPLTGPSSLFQRLLQANITCDDLLVQSLDDVLNTRLQSPSMTLSLHNKIKTALRRRRIQLTYSTKSQKTCCVVTAPHTLKLIRDGQAAHSSEIHTRTLAQRFAEHIGGACITWTKREVDRVTKMIKAGKSPPTSNRDPNFLTTMELSTSPWFFYLVTARRSLLLATQGSMQRSIHCDIHGMKDTTIEGMDVIFGTHAIKLQHQQHGINSERVEHFRNRLQEKIIPVMLLVTEIFNAKHPENQEPFAASVNHKRLDGFAGVDRNTLTQLSSKRTLFQTLIGDDHGGGDDINIEDDIMNDPFSMSVQIELSLRLRRHLFEHKEHAQKFINAVVEAAGIDISA